MVLGLKCTARVEMLEACPAWVVCLVVVDQVDSLELVDSPEPVDRMLVTTMTAPRLRKLIKCLVLPPVVCLLSDGFWAYYNTIDSNLHAGYVGFFGMELLS